MILKMSTIVIFDMFVEIIDLISNLFTCCKNINEELNEYKDEDKRYEDESEKIIARINHLRYNPDERE